MSRKLHVQPAINEATATPTRHTNITLLAVSPNREDRQSLKSILDPHGWTIQGASCIREATQLVKEKPSLIVCDRDLPDGTWKDVFCEADRLDDPPPVVVVSRNADEKFWAEVLNLRGFDVLLKPFERSEVMRVMNSAVRHMRRPLAFA